MAVPLLALLLPLLLACQASGELLMVYSVQRHGARRAGWRAACAACPPPPPAAALSRLLEIQPLGLCSPYASGQMLPCLHP